MIAADELAEALRFPDPARAPGSFRARAAILEFRKQHGRLAVDE